MQKAERDRGGVIPLAEDHWWPPYALAAVMERAQKLGRKQPGWRELAEELVKKGNPTATDDKVRRCVKGEVVTWEIAVPLAELLGILPPAFVADTKDMAEAMNSPEVIDEARRLIRKARQLAIRISKEKGQTSSVGSSHEQARIDRTKTGDERDL